MAKSEEESPEEKIARLETELAQSKRIADAARLALTFFHEMRPSLKVATNIVWLAKTQVHAPDTVTSYLTLVEQHLESITEQSNKVMGMIFGKDTSSESRSAVAKRPVRSK
jgi:hypothetical protein